MNKLAGHGRRAAEALARVDLKLRCFPALVGLFDCAPADDRHRPAQLVFGQAFDSRQPTSSSMKRKWKNCSRVIASSASRAWAIIIVDAFSRPGYAISDRITVLRDGGSWVSMKPRSCPGRTREPDDWERTRPDCKLCRGIPPMEK